MVVRHSNRGVVSQKYSPIDLSTIMSVARSNCSSGFTDVTDFDIYSDCRISLTTVAVLNIILTICSATALVITLGAWLVRWRRFVKKPVPTRALLVGVPITVSLFLLRAILSLTVPTLAGATNLGISILVNSSMILAGYLGIGFIYVQARLLERSAFGRDMAKFQSSLSRNARPICIAIAVVETLGFAVAALPGFYIRWLFPPRIVYFASLIFIDMTCIPLFASITMLIYVRLRDDKKTRDRYKTLSRQLLIVSFGCIGSAVGTLAGSLLGCIDIWPFISYLLPITAVLFFIFMFALLGRKPQSTHSSGKVSGSNGSGDTWDTTKKSKNTSSTKSASSSVLRDTSKTSNITATPHASLANPNAGSTSSSVDEDS